MTWWNDLAQHFREAGKPGADEVRTEWPLVPIPEGVAA